MYRLAVLTRLRRRFPIQIATEAITIHLVNGFDLPESPFIDNEGKFQCRELDRTQLMYGLAGYCSPAVHPAVMDVASEELLEIIAELLGTSVDDNNMLKRAETKALSGLAVSRELRPAHLRHITMPEISTSDSDSGESK